MIYGTNTHLESAAFFYDRTHSDDSSGDGDVGFDSDAFFADDTIEAAIVTD